MLTQKFTVPPEGVYPAKIESAEPGRSKAGNDMLVLSVKLKGQPGAIKAYLVFSPRTKWLVDDFCDSLQLKLPPGTEPRTALLPEHVEGRIGFVQVVHAAWNNQVQAKVDKFLSRETALELNPALATVPLPGQCIKVIPALSGQELPLS